MRYCFILLVLMLYCSGVPAQDLALFKQEIISNPEEVEVQDFTEFFKAYSSNYDEVDSLSKALSNDLLGRNLQRLALINEMARIKVMGMRGNALNATILLDSLETIVRDLEDDYLIGCLHARRGGVYFSISAPKHARAEYLKSLPYFKRSGKLTELKNNLINVGSSYANNKMPDSAMHYYNAALALEKQGVMANQIYLKCNMARVYLEYDEIEQATAIYNEALLHYEANEDPYGKTVTCFNLGDVYHQTGNLELAKQHLQNAVELASTNHLNPLLISASRNLSEVYFKQKDFQTALEYLLIADSVRISTRHDVGELEIGLLKMKHEVESYQQQRLLDEARLENEAKNKAVLWILVGFVSILLLIAIVVNYKMRKKNALLVKQNLDIADKSREVSKIRQQLEHDKADTATALISNLEHAIHVDHVYRDSELTLISLAKILGTNRTYLSEAINQHYNLNYSNLMSSIRIDAAREMLSSYEYDHYSIQGIATHVGFKSVSAFNASFKKITGITPSYFRKSALAVPAE